MFKEIADYLLNIDKEKATGLLVGNAGVSLFLYQVYRKTGQTEFEETADIMLNNILEKQTMLSSTNVRDGLAGIGWGIEFLLQNNFMREIRKKFWKMLIMLFLSRSTKLDCPF